MLSAGKKVQDDVWEHDYQKGPSSDRVARAGLSEEVASKLRPEGCDSNTSAGLLKGKRTPCLGICKLPSALEGRARLEGRSRAGAREVTVPLRTAARTPDSTRLGREPTGESRAGDRVTT